jgi:excisionase family DNA binding protein
MTNHKEISPMLTTSEVARLLNVHINTVRRWSNQGTLKSYRIGSRGDRRFRREDVTSFLSKISSDIISKERALL